MTGRLRSIASWRRGFGEGRLADALLAKWLADPEAASSWARLADDVDGAVGSVPAPPRARVTRWQVVLWRLSQGWSREQVAEAHGVSLETVKQQLKYARKALGVVGASQPALVAAALRRGVIP